MARSGQGRLLLAGKCPFLKTFLKYVKAVYEAIVCEYISLQKEINLFKNALAKRGCNYSGPHKLIY